MTTRFYIDPETGLPHIYKHNIKESEVEHVLTHAGEDRTGVEGTRTAIGQTEGGRYLRVVYIPDGEFDSVFVITAFDLAKKALLAYRKRMRRRQK